MRDQGKYFLGLSLGQTHEFSALAVLQRTGEKGRWSFACRHLERWPPGAPYAEIRDRLSIFCKAEPLRRCALVLDRTGIGKHVVDLLRQGISDMSWHNLAVVQGMQASYDGPVGWLVPRNDLVALLQVLLQSKRLKVADSLPDADLLVQELVSFKARPASLAEQPVESWREGDHDDLVLAIAVAAWFGERDNGAGGKPGMIPTGKGIFPNRPYR